jgi:hypothetical protein
VRGNVKKQNRKNEHQRSRRRTEEVTRLSLNILTNPDFVNSCFSFVPFLFAVGFVQASCTTSDEREARFVQRRSMMRKPSSRVRIAAMISGRVRSRFTSHQKCTTPAIALA